MSRFSDQVRDEFGREVPGVKVYVFVWDASATTAGALETLTADDATPLANPVTTDQFGEFFFNAPDGAKLLEYHFGGKLQYREQIQVGPIPSGPPGGPGALFGLFTNISNVTAGSETLLGSSGYSVVDKGAAVYVYDVAVNSAYVAAHPLSSGLTADAKGFRLSLEQDITPEMFGATGDGTTDDSAAFVAAIAALKAARTQPNSGYGSGSAELFIPAGTYNLGTTTLDITHTMRIRGEGTGGGGGATVLKWSVGTTGIRVQSFNTTGATAVITPTPTDITAGNGTIIEGLLLKGNYAGTESEAHGIHLRGNATIRDCGIYDFAGDGISAHATAGSGAPNEGNDNSSRISNVLIQNCRNGIYFDGADSNACITFGCQFIANRQWGLWDSSFLGNTHIGHMADSNGAATAPFTSWVSNSGNQYYARNGGTWSNAPSGTTADTADWYYYSSGTGGRPAWSAGGAYRAGGPYSADDGGSAQNVWSGCYIEGSQPLAQINNPSLILGGAMRGANKGVDVLHAGGTSGIASDIGFIAPMITGTGTDQEFGSDAGGELTVNLRSASKVGLWALIGGVFKGLLRNTGGVWEIRGETGVDLMRSTDVAVSLRANSLVFSSAYNATLTEIAAASVPNPGGGTQTLFIDTADHKLKRKDSSGAVTIIA